ncbi:MAG: lipopolysaccharide heptosyltransferase II [Desulfobacterales bacterium]
MLAAKILDQQKIKTILIRSANWVGDTIMSTPLIRAVRKNFPDASIHVLAKPWVAPLFDNNPFIDNVLIYDADGRHRLGFGTFRLSADMRKHGFDLFISIQNAFEAALVSFLAGIPRRVGYNTDGRTLLLNYSIPLDPALKKGHLIDYYLGILHGVSLADDGRELDLFVSDKEQARAEDILSGYGLSGKERLIGINPGAKYGTAKRWFPERYAELCNRLLAEDETKILIFGGPGEESLGKYIAEQTENRCINLSGKTGLREAIALIGRCRLFITNDSGLMHAAAALDIPQIAVIGSTDPIATGPSNRESGIVQVPVSCSPCLKTECPIDHRCMTRITVDMVYTAAQELLASKQTHAQETTNTMAT